MYVVIIILWIADCLDADDSPSYAKSKKGDNDTYKAKVGEIGRRHFEAPQG